MLLYGAREWQANATAFRILPKIRQDLPIEGNAHFLRPPFHLGVIIRKLRNIEADAGKEPARVPVGQRGQNGQTFRKCKGVVEGATTTVTIKGLGQGALIPTGQVYDFIGLAVLGRCRQAPGRFLHAAKIEQTCRETTGGVGCAGIDLPRQLGTLQRLVPVVFKSKNVRLATRYPSIPTTQTVGTV